MDTLRQSEFPSGNTLPENQGSPDCSEIQGALD